MSGIIPKWQMTEEDIKLILETAKAFSEVNERAIKKVPTLKGKTIVNMFNEPSTRTRSSFELAEKRLSADSLNFGGSSTSTVKGESLVDTVETLNAYKIDCIVVRDKHAGAPYIVTQNSPASVICAGDGKHNHPTQALLLQPLGGGGNGARRGGVIAVGDDGRHARVRRVDDVVFLPQVGEGVAPERALAELGTAVERRRAQVKVVAQRFGGERRRRERQQQGEG